MPEVTRGNIEAILGHISDRSVKHWLRTSKLAYSAQNEEKYYERIQKLCRKGKLDLTKLKQIALEIEENGSKRIYLKKIGDLTNLKSKQKFENYLNQIGLHLNAEPDISIKYPNEPTLNYIWWSEKEVRVKYSETHTRIVFDYETLSHVAKKLTKYAIVLVDLESGFTQIRLDSPEKVHPHKDPGTGKSKVLLYEEYFFNEFGRILGNNTFELFDVSNAIDLITKTKPRIFRIPRQHGITEDNSHESFSCDIDGDIRDDERYMAMAGDEQSEIVHNNLSGFWIPSQSNGKIKRPLFMEIMRKASMIRFLAECLASEVNYAIGRIREV